MMRLGAVTRSTAGRVAAALVGLTVVAWIVHGLGIAAVGAAIAASAPYAPLIIVLELGVLACSTLALRALYGQAAHAVPPLQLVRAALVGYAVQGLAPTGRAAAEATRASLLARWVGAGRAAAAAARMQAVVLIAVGLVSIPAALGTLLVGGAPWLALAIAIMALVTLGLGVLWLAIARRGKIGAWLGRRFRRARQLGADLDRALVDEPSLPITAVAWELAGRVVQVVQNAVLLACVGGVVGASSALCSEGVHLVGAAVGDLVPAQLGATEGNFTLAAGSLGLTRASAVSIALLAHVAQLVWVVVGSIVFVAWRPPAVTPQPRQEPA